MFNDVYYCVENQKLKKIVTRISLSWESKFLGRRIVPEKYNNLFDHNGYYIENEQYSKNNIIVNVKPTVDSNGYITNISYYKIKDKTYGHGRPQTVDKKLSKRDIKYLSKLLDSVTEDQISEIYKRLMKSFYIGEKLKGDYSVESVSQKGISLMTLTGETRFLNKDCIIQGLTIAQSFIDVLYCRETLQSAPDYFCEEDIPL